MPKRRRSSIARPPQRRGTVRRSTAVEPPGREPARSGRLREPAAGNLAWTWKRVNAARDRLPDRFAVMPRPPAQGCGSRRPTSRRSTGRAPALSPRRISDYIRCAGLPAMAINGRRNKPFGPGGGTRRLHHWGRNRIDEGVKGVLLLGMVPPLSGHCNSCQRQLCSGCSGRVSGLKYRSKVLVS